MPPSVDSPPLAMQRLPKWRAVLEVLAAFAVAHVGFRTFRLFTPWGRTEMQLGLNFSPGFTLALVALVGLWAAGFRGGRGLSEAGISVHPWKWSVRWALVYIVLAVSVGLVILTVWNVPRPPHIGVTSGVILMVLTACVSAVFLWLTRGSHVDAPPPRGVVEAAVIVLLLSSPLISAAIRAPGTLSSVAAALSWRILGAGVGEELFFRGYVQPQLNQAFERRWTLWGVRFGWGLVVTQLLFALIHALNRCDYFRGHWEFAWGHALVTLPAVYGFLREKTGSIAAPVLVHATVDAVGLLR